MAKTSAPSKIWLNGKIANYRRSRVGLLTHGIHYGSSVFEGIRCYWNEKDQQLYSFRLKDHYERLIRNASLLRHQIPYSAHDLCDATSDLLQTLALREDCYIRPLIFIDEEELGVYPGKDAARSVAIIAVPFGDYIPGAAKGIALKLVSVRRVQDSMIPPCKISGFYANSLLAAYEAREAGAQEALLLTHAGNVSECSGQNIFIVRNTNDAKDEIVRRALITPPESDDILLGITRDSIMRIANPTSIDVREASFGPSTVFRADECFLTGTASEIMPVVSLDGRPIGDGNIGDTTLALRDIFQRIARGTDLRDAPTTITQRSDLKRLQEAWLTPIYT